MISKELVLPTNSRLDSIYLINTASKLLRLYNSKFRSDPKKYNINYKLLDRYPTFYNLVDIIDYKTPYTNSELLMIANLVYSLKGSLQSIIKFSKYFDIKVLYSNLDYVALNSSIVLDIDNVESENFNKFMILFKLLITELLLTGVTNSDKLVITTKTLVQQGLINNLVYITADNELLRYIKLEAINT